jgi:hypothetical protein
VTQTPWNSGAPVPQEQNHLPRPDSSKKHQQQNLAPEYIDRLLILLSLKPNVFEYPLDVQSNEGGDHSFHK